LSRTEKLVEMAGGKKCRSARLGEQRKRYGGDVPKGRETVLGIIFS
jgi:hypothetical protein